MVEAGRGLGLALEPLQERLVIRQPLDQDLEGDVPILMMPVPSLQHPGDGTVTDEPADLIAVDEYFRGHGRRPYQTRPHGDRICQ